MATRPTRRARWLVYPLTVLAVLAAVLALPPAHSAFRASTGNAANQLTADRLEPPSGLSAAQTCSATPVIALRSTATATGGTSVVLNAPTGTQAGDVLVVQVAYRYGPTTITAPSGWLAVLTDTSGGQVSSVVYWRVATASEPTAIFSRPSGSSGDMVGAIAAYSGVDTGAPVAAAGSSTGSSATATAPSLSTTATDARLLHLFTKRQEDLPAPTGTTQRWRVMSGSGTATEGITAGDESFAGPGSTPVRSATSASNFGAEWIAQSVVLRRAAGTASAVISWTPSPSSWATGYGGERVVAGTVQATRTVPFGTTTTTDPGLVNGTTYTYRVWAYHGTWVSPVVTTTLTANC